MYILDTILLIDDDPINNFLNRRLLTKMQVANHLLVAESGEEALQLLRQPAAPQPSLILLDINMPGLNGMEFLRQYQPQRCTQQPEPVVVMLSTSVDISDLQQLSPLNINGFISKPLTESKINQLFMQHFGSLQPA